MGGGNLSISKMRRKEGEKMRLATFKECMEDPKKMVGLRFDRVFKEVFGNIKNKDLTVYLLSVLMDKKKSEILSSIKMLPESFEMDSVKQKRRARDLAVQLQDEKKTQINIELNIHEYDPILQDRNMIYLAHFVSHSIDAGQAYSEIKDTIQYNLNCHYADPKGRKLIDTYYVKNDAGRKFTKIIKIVCWNIYKMKNIWYDGSIKSYSKEMQRKIRLGALIMLDDRKDFLRCLNELDAPIQIKKKLERIVIDLNENTDELWTRYYDPEEEAEKIRITYENIGLERGMAQGMERGMAQGMERGTENAVRNMHKHNMDVAQIATIMNLKQQDVYKYLQM